MELTKFPHNLLLDSSGEFLHLQKPISNILSTEWYLKYKNEVNIDKNFSKSIWIPTSGGDTTINMLYSFLENCLSNYMFSIFQNELLPSPISSELNIVCSHGSRNIASVQVLYSNGNPMINLDQIIGNGKILIFFVCYSGSFDNELFRNDISSIVKTYIKSGYKAVVAPCWALHVNIPSIWLPVFLDSLDKGLPLDFAVFEANKAVSEKYSTPAAWACMHLYGNPNMAINTTNYK